MIGRLGDMYGKEKLLLWTLLILAFGTLLAALSNSLGLLIVARVIQGVAGGIFPLAFSIARDEFPRERVAGSIGLMSSILGVGSGLGLVLGAVISQHLGWHWLFWIPLIVTVIAAACTWRWIPESPIRAPGRVNWLAAVVMTIGMSLLLIGIAQTTTWGWGSPKSLALIVGGLAVIALWVAIEVRSDSPLVDMTMMRIRGVWTTNLAAFLIGAGMYSSFIVFPEFAQLPKSTGFGFGASVVASSLYLLPAAVGMVALGSLTGRVTRRYGSKARAGRAARRSRRWPSSGRRFSTAHPYDILISCALMGIGIGLAFSALGNLIVGAVRASPDGRRERHEHRHADAGRRHRRPDIRDVHRRSHAARAADGDRFHAVLLDGRRLPGRRRCSPVCWFRLHVQAVAASVGERELAREGAAA